AMSLGVGSLPRAQVSLPLKLQAASPQPPVRRSLWPFRQGLACLCAAGSAYRPRLARAARVVRRALPEVKLNTTRPDLWDGSVMVLFLRAQDGKAQLGRIGTYLDKVTTSGKLQKLIDDTGFTASPATSELLEVSDKGLQRVLMVGLGEKDSEDWRKAGDTAGAAIATIEGSASL
ncbi:unnamed protein product, partial [Symbiodinium pilosum]